MQNVFLSRQKSSLAVFQFGMKNKKCKVVLLKQAQEGMFWSLLKVCAGIASAVLGHCGYYGLCCIVQPEHVCSLALCNIKGEQLQ